MAEEAEHTVIKGFIAWGLVHTWCVTGYVTWCVTWVASSTQPTGYP